MNQLSSIDDDVTPTPQGALALAVKIAGSQHALAAEIGVKQQNVWTWMNKGRRQTPAEFCIPIEIATCGKVTRYDLRPDIYPDTSPNGAKATDHTAECV